MAIESSAALDHAIPDGTTQKSAAQTLPSQMVLPRRMVRACKRMLFRKKLFDSQGAELTGGQLLLRTLLLYRLLLREIFHPDEKHVGILIPPSMGGVVVNAAVTFTGRVSANLNYSASSSVLNACIERAGIRRVLTSRRVMQKLGLDLNAELVFVEDLRSRLSLWDKLVALSFTYLAPASWLERSVGLDHIDHQDVLTIIFTSGSTGTPKGVVLTYNNVGTNVQAIDDIVHLRMHDTILGVLPFFHSFGYTVTMWAPLAMETRVAYHIDPRDARAIGKLARKTSATILLATPTFLRFYVKRCKPDEFQSLNVVVTGAEKLPSSLADAFEQQFGLRPVEGYGTTELSPLVSVNVPPSRSDGKAVDRKEGTVGRPVAGVMAKTVHPETFEDLPQGAAGMLLISGPNVMKGYFAQDEKTAEVLRDGWYVTGDIAEIDEDGFITITGRLSRFSKIGGEMVPHMKVEEVLLATIGGSDEDEVKAVVSSVSDERKGERLIVVHKSLDKSPEEIRDSLREAGLPNLWIPSADSFLEVDEIPILGSGKTDLKAVSDLVHSHFDGTST